MPTAIKLNREPILNAIPFSLGNKKIDEHKYTIENHNKWVTKPELLLF